LKRRKVWEERRDGKGERKKKIGKNKEKERKGKK